MSLKMQSVLIDAVDPQALANWWVQAIGWDKTYDAADEVVLEPPAGTLQRDIAPDLLFLKVPEKKVAKNRLHIDFRPDDQAAEVARLEALGACRVDVGQGPEVTWVVLADPEGNEFCVLRAFLSDEQT